MAEHIAIRVKYLDQLLDERDALRAQLALYRDCVEAADVIRGQASNYTRSDIGDVDTVLVEAMQDYDTARAKLPEEANRG